MRSAKRAAGDVWVLLLLLLITAGWMFLAPALLYMFAIGVLDEIGGSDGRLSAEDLLLVPTAFILVVALGFVPAAWFAYFSKRVPYKGMLAGAILLTTVLVLSFLWQAL